MTPRRLLALTVFLLAAIATSSAQTPVQYIYDDLGRLIAVIDGSGAAAVYSYDAVGNLLSIDRRSSTTVSIIAFSPTSGPVGTTVTIHGTGFSATPSQDGVTFNGTAASVSSATATQLVVAVPTGATTGAIAVTAPAGSATSASVFTVGGPPGAPTITSFTPSIAVSGTAVTVTGTNFDASTSNDVLRINLSPTQIGSATTTTINSSVPATAATGRLSVATPNGTAVSTSYLWVPPPPYGVSDVSSTTALPFSTATSVSVPTAGKVALLAFDNLEGHRASINITGNTGGSSAVYLFDPFGKLLSTVSGILTSAFLDAVALRSTATYSVVFDPATTSATSATLTLYDVPADISGTISFGVPVTVTATVPGQNGRLTFVGAANQRVSLNQSGFNCFSSATSILAPDGSAVASGCGGAFIDVTTLPSAGTYTVLVDPKDATTGSTTVTLYNVPADVTGTITAGGSATTMTTTTMGQNGSLTFSGTAGQRISLKGTNGMSGFVVGCDVLVRILNPDSSVLATDTCMEASGFIDVKTLPTTGTYTVKVDPQGIATGSLTLTLYSVPADASGAITPGGSSVTVTTTTPGQNGALTFTGTAGHRISLVGTNGISGQIALVCDVNVSILNPDSSVLAPATCMESSGFIDVKTLATTGTYTIKVDPTDIAVGSVTLRLYDVPTDPTTTLTVGGGSRTLTTTTPGQNAQAVFAGTSGQAVTVHVTGNTMGSVTVKLLKPDGTQLTSTSSSSSSFNLATQTLGTTGTYTIVIDPSGTNVGGITVSVTHP